jgi:hypothetical protein
MRLWEEGKTSSRQMEERLAKQQEMMEFMARRFPTYDSCFVVFSSS